MQVTSTDHRHGFVHEKSQTKISTKNWEMPICEWILGIWIKLDLFEQCAPLSGRKWEFSRNTLSGDEARCVWESRGMRGPWRLIGGVDSVRRLENFQDMAVGRGGWSRRWLLIECSSLVYWGKLQFLPDVVENIPRLRSRMSWRWFHNRWWDINRNQNLWICVAYFWSSEPSAACEWHFMIHITL
jgi:hypothetical protein